MCEHGTTVLMPIRGRVVEIDQCISHLVAALNAGGLTTVASCCGHGNRPGSIVLEDGRELLILLNQEWARHFDSLWPDIHGAHR